VTVLVPASDVRAGTEVDAVVTPGHVAEYKPAAELAKDGSLVRDSLVVGRAGKSDTLVIRAIGDQEFGKTKVSRLVGYDVLIAAGLTVLIGGVATSAVAASIWEADHRHYREEGPIIGAVGVAGSITLGMTLLLIGLRGELRVTQSSKISLSGLTLRF
jgi:hypothetical protein